MTTESRKPFDLKVLVLGSRMFFREPDGVQTDSMHRPTLLQSLRQTSDKMCDLWGKRSLVDINFCT